MTARPHDAREAAWLWQLYRRVLREARPYRGSLLGLLVLSLLSTPLALLTPLPLAIAIDSVLGDQPLPGPLRPLMPGGSAASDSATLLLAVALVVVIAVLSQLRSMAKALLKTYTGQRLVLSFRARLFGHAQRLSLSYHDTAGTSDSTYRIHYDANALKTLALDGVIPFVSATVTLLSMVFVTARIDPALALVAVSVIPCLLVALRLSAGWLRGGWQGVKRLDSSIMALVAETLAGVRVVKAFGQEDRERQRFEGRAREKLRARLRLSLLENGLGLLVSVIMAAGTAAVLYIGVNHIRAGVLTLGSLTLVMGYLAKLYSPLQSMSQRIGEVQEALVGTDRAFALLDLAPDVHERPHARPLRRASGEIAFDRVSFAYAEGPPALTDVSFHVPSGTRLGIVGATGAGKTTLVSLLTRFYDPTGGRILLDGTDLRDYRLADLRDQFAIVLQEPVLFSTTIAENVAYARPDADRDAIVAAAEAACAHGFISHLPQGYDTLVGERGMRLSGGERQRISLARAFLKDAPILILDEPTSSVDSDTESLIVTAMDRLMTGRTALLIAHRASTLRHCDAWLKIDGGRPVVMASET